ncbi:hypothetical protein BpHYR1_026676 [Brachionus plicatilis]|uniref:Uncharacterized protein n=1 Tax=Brachionus plicatilis TaxID=10195 RepID=A0A3M7Q357_BRAPC|nr:hypothetical protein BpHYR1_026676 [Brachionus plicatilis]
MLCLQKLPSIIFKFKCESVFTYLEKRMKESNRSFNNAIQKAFQLRRLAANRFKRCFERKINFVTFFNRFEHSSLSISTTKSWSIIGLINVLLPKIVAESQSFYTHGSTKCTKYLKLKIFLSFADALNASPTSSFLGQIKNCLLFSSAKNN